MTDITTYDTINCIPTMSFIAGTTKEIVFNVYQEDGVNVVAVDSATWVLCPYGEYGDYTLKYTTPTEITITGAGSNVLTLTIPSGDTEALSGKYIQQISITNNATGYTFRPSQGEILIFPAGTG